MSAMTVDPMQSAISLLTIASHQGSYGEQIATLVSATVEQDLIDTGSVAGAIEHLGGVLAGLAHLGAQLAQTLAEVYGCPVDDILAAVVRGVAAEADDQG